VGVAEASVVVGSEDHIDVNEDVSAGGRHVIAVGDVESGFSLVNSVMARDQQI
jgi:hypothetical protein